MADDIGVMTPEKQAAIALLQSRGAPLTGENLARALTIVYRGANSNDLRPIGDFEFANGRTTKRGVTATTGADRGPASGGTKPSGASASSTASSASSSDKPFDRTIDRTADISKPGDVTGRQFEGASPTGGPDQYGVSDPSTVGLGTTWSDLPDWLKLILGVTAAGATGSPKVGTTIAKGVRKAPNEATYVGPMRGPVAGAITDQSTRLVPDVPGLLAPAQALPPPTSAVMPDMPPQVGGPAPLIAIPGPDGTMQYFQGGAPVISVPPGIGAQVPPSGRMPNITSAQPPLPSYYTGTNNPVPRPSQRLQRGPGGNPGMP